MNERQFTIQYSTSAVRDLDRLPQRVRNQILRKIERLKLGLRGNIKHLRRTDTAYRLRAGDFRILFDVTANIIIIRRIEDRKNVYD